MDKKRDEIKRIQKEFLFHAISYISIIDVEEKENFNGSVNIYIKTNNLSTVEMDNLKLLANNLSGDEFDIQVVKADNKLIGESISENTDTISVYIE